MSTIVSIWLALVLVFAAGAKAARPSRSAAALATYGIAARPRLQRAALWLLVASEAALAVALAVGVAAAPVLAAGLFLLFAAASTTALLAGRKGAPCACFAASARLDWPSPLRSAALAAIAGVTALGWFPDAPSGYARWLTLALSLSVVAIAALAVALLALAREVGVLRLSGGAHGALEIASEGPAVGEREPWAEQVELGPRALLKLAVFSSEGCPLCEQVAPAVAHVAADPLVALRVFDEHADGSVWRAAAVPGSPYAVALSADGMTLAKGTFNSLGQLESVLATARARERGPALAA
ncbi:MAG TPA: MauE/DoxX family redox-associated membrane protein [Solirubrobacteraceae bacterium]|nr:MauE/DoxX family redox-associated membrane protein [Solirubrobacteraceae bacterium]